MITIKDNTINEIIIKNSRFITLLYKINSIDDINKYLEESKKRFPKATHYCYAYILNDYKKASDDGEPSGTAGMPILNVLEKENINKVLAIVIRYFGGIKLGAGGLVRAYSKNVKEAINNSKLSFLIPGKLIQLTFDYSKQKQLDYLLKDNTIIKQNFDEQITYQVLINNNDLDKLSCYNYEVLSDEYIEKDQ